MNVFFSSSFNPKHGIMSERARIRKIKKKLEWKRKLMHAFYRLFRKCAWMACQFTPGHHKKQYHRHALRGLFRKIFRTRRTNMYTCWIIRISQKLIKITMNKQKMSQSNVLWCGRNIFETPNIPKCQIFIHLFWKFCFCLPCG